MSITSHPSPSKGGSSFKSGAMLSNCKSVLSEQHQRLATKHNYDLDLIDDVRTFIKVKCHIEKDYCNALIKLIASHQSKKYPQFQMEQDSDVKSLYTVWKMYMEEMEKMSKHRLAQFEQVTPVPETLKQMKSHKAQIGKKAIDVHLKKMQEEVITSITEIEKTKKVYFEEENFAKSARDKEEKLKKRKGGIFSKFTDLQSKKEKSSAQREASDIQSTQARNEYIMSLVAGNAHLQHYFTLDLPNLIKQLDDDVLDKCKGYMSTLLQSELSSLNTATEGMDMIGANLEATSADVTNQGYLQEPTSACLRETLQYEFEPCENDEITTVSMENNAELALQTEITKWMTCYIKECRNLNRLSQQLIKCQTMLAGGHKSVEVTGVGMVEIESRIDDIKQQLRKCDISKAKAQARLLAIKESGMAVEDLDKVENQITTEMKQSSLDVDVAPLPLSRTPSLRSTNVSDGRASAMESKSYSEDQPEDKNQTPEPGDTITVDFDDTGESPEPEMHITPYSYEAYEAQAWDPTTAWDAEPEPPQVDDTALEESGTYAGLATETTGDTYGDAYVEATQAQIDLTSLAGKTVQALYPYDSQNVDELSFNEGEILKIISITDNDWATAQNSDDAIGFIPIAYVQVLDDAPEGLEGTQKIDSYENDTSDGGFVDGGTVEVTKTVETVEVMQTVVTETDVVTTTVESVDTDAEYVRALYDFQATSDEEISFQEGDLIKILDRSEDGWWLGEKDGIVGHFPSMLVAELTASENEDAAFEEADSVESGSNSPEYIPSPSGPPPPTFAPPKPAYLTPNQVVIIQPTPDVESKGTFGSQEDDEGTDLNTVVEVNAGQPEEFVLEKPKPSDDSDEPDDEEIKKPEEPPPPPPTEDAPPEEDPLQDSLEEIETQETATSEDLPAPPPEVLNNVEESEDIPPSPCPPDPLQESRKAVEEAVAEEVSKEEPKASECTTTTSSSNDKEHAEDFANFDEFENIK